MTDIKKKVAIIASGGVGDCILGFQCAKIVGRYHADVFIASRSEVFQPLKKMFGERFDIYQADPQFGEENSFLSNLEAQSFFKDKYEEVYYVVPDLLFRNPLAFDYKKYCTSPQAIRSQRLLIDGWRPDYEQKTVYVGLTTSTKGYDYPYLKDLLRYMASQLPDYKFYFPSITSWGGTSINYGEQLKDLPSNVEVEVNPSIEHSLEILRKSVYGLFTCNGFSHISYQLGQPRLVLDPQYNKLPWIARWKEDYNDCVSLNTGILDVTKIVKDNLLAPETQLLPRYLVANGGPNWAQQLIFKY